jgi:phage antirepressor YoqD-like protein
MPCGLTDEELYILNVLYQDHSYKCTSSYNLGQIAKAFKKKFTIDPKDVAKNLVNKGYLAEVRKKDIKYYISNMEATCFALNQHGYNATEGRIMRRPYYPL